VLELLYSIGLVMTASYQLRLAIAAAGLAIVVAIGIALLIVRIRSKQFRIGRWQMLAPVILLATMAAVRSSDTGTVIMALAMPLAYLVGVNTGRLDHRVMAATVIIGSISVMVWHFTGLQPAYAGKTGGIFGNPNIAAGGLVMCAVMCRTRWQYVIVAVALAGLCFSGAEQGLVAVAAIGVIVLARHDWSAKILTPAVLVTILLVAIAVSGIWQTTPTRMQAVAEAATNGEMEQVEEALNGRWQQWQLAISDIKPFGHGYKPLTLLDGSIHNVPLRILYELGPAAVLLWLYIMTWGLFRSKLKYPFVAILGLSLFDNYMWTVMMPWCFTAAGMAEVATSSDYIFRKEVGNG